jgi:SPP1 family predicted phage head-tail adaptor
MSIKAGRLRHRITIQERVLTQDSDLNAVYDWQDVASVWAAIEPLSARELLAAQAAQSQV